ncbi:MAG: hypothetical protein AAF581_11185 [Planctomycetota bacterium]
MTGRDDHYDWSLDDLDSDEGGENDEDSPVLYRTDRAEIPVIRHPQVYCPHCSHTSYRVVSTRVLGAVRLRYCLCRSCNRRFCTEERRS